MKDKINECCRTALLKNETENFHQQGNADMHQ